MLPQRNVRLGEGKLPCWEIVGCARVECDGRDDVWRITQHQLFWRERLMLDRDKFACASIASCSVIIRKSGFDALGKSRVKPGKYVLVRVVGIVFALKYSKF